jgi:thiamine-phosphate pyrophosphorylase
MPARQPLPRLWLMTDERQGKALWAALERLPAGSGVVFRHYSLPQAERRRLFEEVRRIARKRRVLLILAGSPRLSRAWRADGLHGLQAGPSGLRTAPAHNLREIRAAERAGADLLFVSSVFATRSHPGARPLGPMRFRFLARSTRLPVAALGGMNEERARRLGIQRWAAIDAWSATGPQHGAAKRKAGKAGAT